MKKINLASAFLAISLFTGSVYADIELKSVDDVQGSWKLQYTKNSATAKETINREDTWVFQGGKITILNIPREGKHYDQPPVNYEIDNGKLKIPYVGRSGFDTFSLVEKDDKTMTLKGKFGEIYYFNKK
ncbi:hypothetical protein [Methylomicrobium lacus]|uniref:hypothetical protein n=1 Tax=Methylomicrobium lacus TaxID=136992 RepID=UPI00045EAC1D|nr:hypothetical protein [Methylomicrobium lacus]